MRLPWVLVTQAMLQPQGEQEPDSSELYATDNFRINFMKVSQIRVGCCTQQLGTVRLHARIQVPVARCQFKCMLPVASSARSGTRLVAS